MNNYIRVERARVKMSQETLAQKVGVSRVFISNIERNKVVPRLDLVIKIAKALERKVEDIFIIEG